MQLFEVFRQAFDSIRASKLRSGLTLLAISVGVFAIISANTAVLVLDTYFRDTLSLMGGDVITVSKFPAVNMGPSDWDRYRNREDITVDQMERLKSMMPVSAEVGPNRTFRREKIQYNEAETNPDVQIQGANEHFLGNNAYSLDEGRNFLPEDMEHRRNVAILGSEVAELLFEIEHPIGKIIRIEGHPYTVIGVTEAKGSVFGNSLDRFVLLPYTITANKYGRNSNIGIQLRAGSVDRVEAVMDELIGILRIIRQVDPAQPNDFEIATNESISGSLSQFTGFLYLIGFIIGGIVLLGAGIGVMNIMLVSVTERTREIGIRKAVGADRKAVIYQFLIEAVIVCQLGGLIGIFLGIVAGNILVIVMETTFVLPVFAIFAGIIGMTAIGVIFGVYPAWKAARLDPIESLRFE